MRIISDLEYAGYVSRRREGRTNMYHVYTRPAQFHADDRDVAVKDLTQVLSTRDSAKGSV